MMNDVQLWLQAELAKYQMARYGRVHPKDVVEALAGALESWRFFYGEDGTENLEWCDKCGWYCECGK